jgi:uncharacterized membrane protein YraQ (UPF0718 family)
LQLFIYHPPASSGGTYRRSPISNAAGIIPILQALLEKGAALGTALAFMMSVIGLSLPEMIILKKVMKLPLIIIFISVVAMGIMIVGFIFNWIY